MKNAAIIYFSGTGNTRYLAHRIRHELNEIASVCANISKPLNFASIINCCDFIFICYPVYGSAAPEPMELFIEKYAELIKGKNTGVVVTQALFSGDGADFMARKLKKLGANVKCTEHFIMPDNESDVYQKAISEEKITKILNKTNKKITVFVSALKKDTYSFRGKNPTARLFGAIQREACKKYFPILKKNIKVDKKLCVGCGWCEENCPVGNMAVIDKSAVASDKCVLCYRCVNGCKGKAINIMGKNPPICQYKGLSDRVIP